MKILHLDDHHLFTEGLAAILATYGITIISASTTVSAIDLLDEQRDFDLIIADLSMPDLDGYAFIQSIKQRKLLIPIAVLSATEDLWQIKKAITAGAIGFIPKTYKSVEIVSAINVIMTTKKYIPENIKNALARLPDKEPEALINKQLSAYKISHRQLDVLQLMHKGYSNEEVATILNISKNTVKTHVKHLFSAFSVNNRIECIRFAERVNLI